MDKTLILGECKWNRHPIDWDVLSGLVEKTGKVVPAEDQWKIHYLGFARQGWTDAARQYAGQIASGNLKGAHWLAVGMQLLDVDHVDEDLAEFSV